ncbi:MAG: Crp/Fnr family transcriptional regulator [Spirochaetaceae bacterium]|nr:Crp/Fnr family transcriptional regulator [Spirochaetaceae bacterium]
MPKAISFSKDSVIYFLDDKDDRIFIVQTGMVVLSSIDIENQETVHEFVKKGEFFGVKSAFGRFPREETAIAATDSVIISLTLQEFEKMVSSNKSIMMQMLRVFSKQLRTIHKKIEQVLNNSVLMSNEEGMFSVAKAFFKDEQFKSCCDVCLKLLHHFPNTQYKNDVSVLYAAAKKHYVVAQQNADDDSLLSLQNNEEKAFFLPAFARFAKRYHPEDVIICEFEKGDSFYFIQSGTVQLVKCINGTKKNLDILKPGEFFGEMAILENSPRSATCVATSLVEVLEFNKENFELLLQGNPQMALILIRLFCNRINEQKRRFSLLTEPDSFYRVGKFFLSFDEFSDTIDNAEDKRKFSLSAQDIAHWTGLTEDIVRIELNKYAERRKIQLGDNCIVINNVSDLKRYIETHSIAH